MYMHEIQFKNEKNKNNMNDFYSVIHFAFLIKICLSIYEYT